MASLHDDDAGGELAGLLDDWSDSELLPLFAPIPSPNEGDDCSVAASEGATNAHAAATLALTLGPQPIADRGALEDSTSSPIKSEAETCAKAKRTSDSNVTRKREREELRRLEAEAYGLEMQLASTLRHRQLAEGGTRHGGGYSSMEMWAQVARNQLLAKQKAELQNATLRELLREQLRLARSMERMVSRRPSDTALYRVFGSTNFIPRKRLRSGTSIDDNLTFHRLFQSVDRSYKELDRVFLWDSNDSKTPRARAEASEYKQFMYSAVIPFEMKAAMAAAWGFLSRDQQGVAGGEYRVIKRTPSTIACESVAAIGAPSDVGETHIQLRCAMKKTEERDRIVLVWQSTTAREFLSSSSGTSEPTLEQSGWLVLSDAPVSSSGAVATRIQMCVRHPAKLDARPAAARGSSGLESLYQQTAAACDNGCALDLLTELIFRDAQQNVGAWYQYVENILMEQQQVGSTNRAAG